MADIFGTQIQVEVRINKKTGKYTVTILDHGEKIGCTEIDSDGESLHGKIVKYISEQMSGGPSEEPQLTKKGEMEHRHEAVTFNPLEEDEEEENEGYNPLDDSPVESDPYDVGKFGI
jgi:hypothetical protein